MKYVWLLLACVLVAGCDARKNQSPSPPPSTTASATPVATPSAKATIDAYGVFSVVDAGKAGVPRLTARQMAWLDLIHRDPAYRSRWPHLRWTLADRDDHIPVIVFDYDPPDEMGEFPIIGDVCTAAFEPSENSMVALSHFDIPCKPSEQSRVRGERQLLGWEP